MIHTPITRSHHTPPIPPSRSAPQGPRPKSRASLDVLLRTANVDELLLEVEKLRGMADVSREMNHYQAAIDYYRNVVDIVRRVLDEPKLRRALSAAEQADLEKIESTISGWLKQARPLVQTTAKHFSPNTPPYASLDDDALDFPATMDIPDKYRDRPLKTRTDTVNHSRQRSDGLREKVKDREVSGMTEGERERATARETRKERKESEQSGWAEARKKRDKDRGRDRRSKLASLHGPYAEDDAALGDSEVVDFSAAADDSRPGGLKDSLGATFPLAPLTPAKTPERMVSTANDAYHDDSTIHTPQSPMLRARSLRDDPRDRDRGRRYSDFATFNSSSSSGSGLRERAISNARRSSAATVDTNGDPFGGPPTSAPIYHSTFTDTPKAGNSSLQEEPSRPRHSLSNIHTRASEQRAKTEPASLGSGSSSGTSTPRARSPNRGQTVPTRLPSDEANPFKLSPVNKVWNDVPGLRSPPINGGFFPASVPGKKKTPVYSSASGSPSDANERAGARTASGSGSGSSAPRSASIGPKEKRFAYPHEASPYKGPTEKSTPFDSNSLPRDIQTPPAEALLFKATPGTSGRSYSEPRPAPAHASYSQTSASKPQERMSQAELDALPPWKKPATFIPQARAPPPHPAPPPQPPPPISHAPAPRPHHTQSDPFGYPHPVPVPPLSSTHSTRTARKKRQIYLPRAYMTEFLNIAERNTRANKETVALLLGTWESDAYYVSVLLIPPQESTYRSATITRDLAVREYQTNLKLTVLGTIHYHIGDDNDRLLSDSFNSVDLHRLCRYQSIVPEAFGIGIRRGPTRTGTEYVMRALTPEALRSIQMCRRGDDMHWHGTDDELFEEINRDKNLEHVHHTDGPFKTIDLREHRS